MNAAPDRDDVDEVGDGLPGWAQVLGLQRDRVQGHEFDPLMRLLATASGRPLCALWVVDGLRNEFVAVHGLQDCDIPADSRLAELTLQRGRVLEVDAAAPTQSGQLDPLMMALQLTHFAALTVYGPRRQPVGLLCAMARDGRASAAQDRRLHDALHDAREVLETQLCLRADALHDPISGAMARRPFVELADREWRRAMRGLHAIGVVVAVLDHFDALIAEGQAAVDRGLRAAVLAMEYSVHRPGDVVCRYDSQRFVLMLPGTDRKGATSTAERVRQALEALRVPLQAGGTLTLSAAVHLVATEALSRGNLACAVETASKALRIAQTDGANRWVLAGETPA